jgi:hypothetical protein
MDTKVLVRVNNVDLVSTSDEQLIAIKPICEAIGINFPPQFKKIKEDKILSSAVTLRDTTGADGKIYQMCCLPVRYIFGWLFTINPANVTTEAQESVFKYKQICYDVLYDYFTGQQKRVIEQNKVEIAVLEDIFSNLSTQQSQIKQSLADKRRKLELLREERLNNEPTSF